MVEWCETGERQRIRLLIFNVRFRAGGDTSQKTRDNIDDIAVRDRAIIRKRPTLDKETTVYEDLG